MNFVLKPSLEHMALVEIGISLWSQIDVKTLIEKHNFKDLLSNKKWEKIESRVIEKVPKLLIPQLLSEKLLGFVKPIGIEISMWIEYNYKYLRVNLPAEFCWTSQGTVDRKKTAEMLVKNEKLDMSTRYKLACFYCLEKDIFQLWSSMPENLKESNWSQYPLIGFWSRDKKRKVLGNQYFFYKYDFLLSATYGNRVAAEYFLQKLTPRERKECLVKAVQRSKHADTVCFLLTQMNEEQQMEVFKNSTYRVLKFFLEWPFQCFFVGIANRMWDFLSKNYYNNILYDIVYKVRDGYNDWYYQNLFKEFWQKSPNDLKSFVTNEIDSSLLLKSLLQNKDKENIILVFQDTNLVMKEKLIYSDTGDALCESFIRNNEWNILKFFIRECLPSKTEMLKFKEDFERRMLFSYPNFYHEWDKLFCFSDDFICKHNKRSVEDNESSSSKRYCVL